MLPHLAQENKLIFPATLPWGLLEHSALHPHSSRQREGDQEGSNKLMALLALLALLLPAALGQDCPRPCRCVSLSPPEPGALLVDCSSRGLRSVPAVPRRARSLLLHNNSLASLPAGALDGLAHLRHLQLADNPWHCDCGIRYLQLWLQDFSSPALAALRCASPAPLATKPLAQLAGGDLGACARLPPASCLQFFWRDLVLLAGATATLLLAAWALRRSKRLLCRLTLSRRRRRSIPKTRKTQ